MMEVFFALLRAEGVGQGSHASPRGFDGALVGFAKQGLELGKDHLDRVQIRAAGRQEQQMCPGLSDELAGRLALVAAEVVGNHDVAGSESWHKALADPGGEAVTVDWPVQNEGGDDAVVTQPGEES